MHVFRLPTTVALAILYGKIDRTSYDNRRQKSNYIQDTEVLFYFIWVWTAHNW